MSRFDDWATHLDPDLGRPDLDPARADALDRIGEVLRAEATWSEPPPSLRNRLLADAALQRADLTTMDRPLEDSPASDSPPARGRIELDRYGSVPGDPRWSGPSRDGVVSIDDASTPARARARARWLAPAVAAVAAAAVAAVALFAWPQLASEVDDGVTTYEVAGTELAPDASALVDVEPLGAGVAITLNITGLAPAAEGEYYAGWLTGDDGMVGIGSFHWREGGIPIELWSGVDVERYPNLGITIQQEGEPTTSSGRVVFRGRLVDQ